MYSSASHQLLLTFELLPSKLDLNPVLGLVGSTGLPDVTTFISLGLVCICSSSRLNSGPFNVGVLDPSVRASSSNTCAVRCGESGGVITIDSTLLACDSDGLISSSTLEIVDPVTGRLGARELDPPPERTRSARFDCEVARKGRWNRGMPSGLWSMGDVGNSARWAGTAAKDDPERDSPRVRSGCWGRMGSARRGATFNASPSGV